MAQLHVVGILQARPGAEGSVAPLVKELAEATRKQDGCISCDPYESAAVPGTFVTVEQWRDQAALDAHLNSPEVRDALARAGQLFIEGGVTVHPLKEL